MPIQLFFIGLVHLAVDVESLFERCKDLRSTHHHDRPPLLRGGDFHRVDRGEKDAVADADEEAAEVDEHVGVHEHVEVPEVDEREAGGAGDADPGHQDGRAR